MYIRHKPVVAPLRSTVCMTRDAATIVTRIPIVARIPFAGSDAPVHLGRCVKEISDDVVTANLRPFTGLSIG